MFKNALVCCMFFSVICSAQQHIISGKVVEKSTGLPLSYANIIIEGMHIGTAANMEGKFEFKLKPGTYKIISSFIGFKSDTTIADLYTDKNFTISLESIPVKLSEITVLPKENPAIEILRRTIKAKHERDKKIESYIFKAYTKGLVKTTKDLTTSGQSASYSLGTKDTGQLKITGIIENESRGYFKKPDLYKDEIIARKQTANTPSTINIFTGGRLLQNFYTNDIQFFGRQLIGPISDDALDYYYYIIEDTLAMDDKNIFKISFEPIDESDPGFYGHIFIADSIFAMIKLDVNLNKAASPGSIFDKTNIFQQFVPYSGNIYMPIDYRIFVEGNLLGMAKFGFELNSVFYDYNINPIIGDDNFGMALVTVQPDADTKDSAYWKQTHSVPNTFEEIKAYSRIDSLESIPRNFWDDFSFFAPMLFINKNISLTGPAGLYGFNKVEGHKLNFSMQVIEAMEKRLNGNFNLGYGINDKKLKNDFSLSYYTGNYRTAVFSARYFNTIKDLFGESVLYSNITSTLTSIFGKYDFRDYYYSRGWEARISGDVLPFLRVGAGLLNRTDNRAVNNSDYSIFNRSKSYSPNKPIYEAKINAVTTSFTIDFRKYIEDGYRRLRTSQNKAYAILSGDAMFSNKSIKSFADFQFYSLKLSGSIPWFKSTFTSFLLNGIYSHGSVPYQMLYSIPGNIDGCSKFYSFRTLSLGEIVGDRGVILNVQHNFRDELFRALDVPLLKNWQLILTTHFNAALLKISEKSKNIFPIAYSEFVKPFYEIGFGLGQMMIPFSIEFTWKLNYRGANNFVISVNSILL